VAITDVLPPLDPSSAARRTLVGLAGAGATDAATGLSTWRGLQARLEGGRADAPVCGAVVYLDRIMSGSRRSPGDDPLMRSLGEELRRRFPRGTEIARLDAQELVIVIPGHSAGLVDPVAVVHEVAQRLGSDPALGLHPDEVACCPLAPTTAGGLLGQIRRVQTKLLVGGRPAEAAPEPAGPGADEIGRAIERSEFRLAYQPVLDGSGAVVAVEALLRWETAGGGLLLPGAFLPAVEREGMDVEVGSWVLRRALSDAAMWHAAALAGVPVVVNVSAAQLASPDLPDLVAASVADLGAPGVMLEIAPRPDEVDLHQLVGSFEDLRAAGALLSLDRVDRSAVSAGLLAVLPFVDTVKLDRSVVADLHGGGRATAAALRILARSAGVRLGATGVETGDQLAALRELGVEYVQGYRFCPPVRIAELAARTAPLGASQPR
jgi:EAL domain-containing protein (putative c-di-GMP-specific phosphodiesterase class I)